jgi:hypothetical protein
MDVGVQVQVNKVEVDSFVQGREFPISACDPARLEHLSLFTSKPLSICYKFHEHSRLRKFQISQRMHSPKRCSTLLNSKSVIHGKDAHSHGTNSLL